VGSRIASVHTSKRSARGLALFALLALLVLGLVACGGSASTGGGDEGTSGGGDGGDGGDAAAVEDSFKTAYPTAQEAMQALAEDCVLFSAGTAGLALADVPDSWSFNFYSPGKNMLYTVNVEHGAAVEPREFGEAAEGTTITRSVDPGTIDVGAAEAVVTAREFGSASGELPMNVMVSGTFAETKQSVEAGLSMGVWEVTFATGTDLADAQAFTVDMMSGEVAAAKE
jgi:hypothetical protein